MSRSIVTGKRRNSPKTPLLEALKQRILILDGGLGTSIQARNPSLKDYRGLEGNTEILNITRPDLIFEIHCDFLNIGCDAIETNTFGANSVVQSEYGLADQVFALNAKAVEIARQAAKEKSSPDRAVYIFGSVGPGTKLPTLGHIQFQELYAAYHSQIEALIEGGVDALLIETSQDLLQAKAAFLCAQDLLNEKKVKLPIFIQITVEATGTMLIGTEVQAAVSALGALPVDGLGLNCATGPEKMVEHIRTIAQHFPGVLSVLPNAGIPKLKDGQAVYPLQPSEFAAYHERFVSEMGINLIGGCCGTTPEHLRLVVEKLWGKAPKKRKVIPLEGCSSSFQFVSFQQNPRPLIIGERTNANGSKKFKTLLAEEKWDELIEMAREQEQEGCHMLDVCLAFVGREESKDLAVLAPALSQKIRVPISIDSTQEEAIEQALQRIGGRCLINSVNLEDGGQRLHRVAHLAKRYGAALVALTIDEKGMAKTVERKVEVASRIYNILHKEYGFEPYDLLFDPLTFTLGSGDKELRNAGLATLQAISKIKATIPGCYTILGVSNISFGLKKDVRRILNSVFLHEAVQAGLDAAILHAGKILPLAQIEKSILQIMLDLIYNRRRGDVDPLSEVLKIGEEKRSDRKVEQSVSLSLEERLKQRIIEGKAIHIEEDLEQALKNYAALEIVNQMLIPGMEVVGDLFGKGELQLPFVLQSAEVMKKAVSYLEPYMEKKEIKAKGKIVLATVRGDVHDIGKNLVDIILTNNGYQVENLGIKVPLQDMLTAAKAMAADAIGMSGLLVKSVQVMKENLVEINRLGESFPILLGGAALHRRYVEDELSPLYRGKVFYAKDAFEGMKVMENIESHLEQAQLEKQAAKVTSSPLKKTGRNIHETSKRIGASPVPIFPFYGRKVLRNFSLNDIFPFINKIALFRSQWQFKQGKLSWHAYQELIQEKVEPIFARLKEETIEKKILVPQAVIGFYPCYKEQNDLVLLEKDLKTEKMRFSFPRQQRSPYLCLSDFILEKGQSIDNIAFSAVTVGSGASVACQELFEKNHYQEYLYLHGFAVEAAEALAEFVHRKVRQLWKIDGQDAPSPNQIIKMRYQGCRYSFGYPACPNLHDQCKLFNLLGLEEIGMSLTEGDQLVPEQSTTAIIFHHKGARYFNVE